MNNILIVTIDSLSQWYINNSGNTMPFFKQLTNDGLSLLNVYSTGPFTEAAISGFWYGKPAMTGWNYAFENNYSNDNIFELFGKKGFDIYLGKLVPFYSERMSHTFDMAERENPVQRAFEHLWRGRLNYYCSMDYKDIKNKDLYMVEKILDCFFSTYIKYSDKVKYENNYYEADKKNYIDDILNNKRNCRFFKFFNSDLFRICNEKGCVELENRIKNPLTVDEILLCDKIKVMNRLRMLKFNRYIYNDEQLSPVLETPMNRCVISNDNVSSLIRNRNEFLPKLGEELQDFLLWYDNNNHNNNFFAYIHNYDFHYPEDFIIKRFENDEAAYFEEIKKIRQELDYLVDIPMTITKQLTIKKIDELICRFVSDLNERDFFEDSVLIITADHGITNFMYPVRRKNTERWNYNSTNFNVPFYVLGIDRPRNIKGFVSTQCIPYILKDIALNKTFDIKAENYLVTSWINGTPDLIRNPIKYGYRSMIKSVTIQLKLTEFLISADINGVYNLKNDPNELHNITEFLSCEEKKSLLLLFSLEWERIIREYLLGKGECIIYKSLHYQIIEDVWDYLISYNKTIKYYSKKDFLEKNSNVIICGTDQKTQLFIQGLPESVLIEKVLTLGRETSFCGHVCESVIDVINEDNTIIIASEYEIEYVAILKNKGFSNYYLMSQLI